MGRSFLSTSETWDKGRNKSRSVCFWCLWATLWAGERHLFSMIFAPSSCTRGCSRVGFNEKRLWTPLNGMEGWARSTNVNSRNRRSRVHFPPRATCEAGEHMETNAWQLGYTNGFEWRADSGGAFLVCTCFQILRIWDYQGFILTWTASWSFRLLYTGYFHVSNAERRARRSAFEKRKISMSQTLNGELAVQDARHRIFPCLKRWTASSPFRLSDVYNPLASIYVCLACHTWDNHFLLMFFECNCFKSAEGERDWWIPGILYLHCTWSSHFSLLLARASSGLAEAGLPQTMIEFGSSSWWLISTKMFSWAWHPRWWVSIKIK